jgi:1-acyl-sn-glycerol-3-phosphate acyltransferase
MTRRRVTFLAKNEYFTGRGLKGRAKAAFVRGTGLIPLDRGDADAAAGALSTGARAVSDGRLLGVYPEGTRSPDGRLYRGKTGIARIALETGVPIVPVAMIGTDHVLPIGRSVPQLGRVEIRIGAPIWPPSPAAEGTPEAAGQARELTEQVMAAIAALSGQGRVDVDCSTHKHALSAKRRSFARSG